MLLFVETKVKLLVLMKMGDDMLEMVGDRPGHDQKYALDHSKARFDQCDYSN